VKNCKIPTAVITEVFINFLKQVSFIRSLPKLGISWYDECCKILLMLSLLVLQVYILLLNWVDCIFNCFYCSPDVLLKGFSVLL